MDKPIFDNSAGILEIKLIEIRMIPVSLGILKNTNLKFSKHISFLHWYLLIETFSTFNTTQQLLDFLIPQDTIKINPVEAYLWNSSKNHKIVICRWNFNFF
jgi:hypothetical protein